ncbi:hypothetical protein HEP81_04667 [Streptomyces griseofuscus]|uniref:C2H2-type domain-containing protein n=2 Tax=Streptomyces griseofuscus TaxID=146922 RepID=A0A7H1Q3Q9_9ACTN|nr:hypothetical protein HEP81_04667 [Streptomyces griseofuscus]
MPPELIRVQPTAALRREFALWAVAQNPKVRTASHYDFAVPADQFIHMPEHLLIGSVVDGHRYVSPDEDQAQKEPADSGGAELLGVGLPEREGIPGEPLPEVPAEAYPAGAEPTPAADTTALEDAQPGEGSDSSDQADGNDDQGDGGEFTCDVCSRPFKSERGRDTHRRQAHPEA